MDFTTLENSGVLVKSDLIIQALRTLKIMCLTGVFVMFLPRTLAPVVKTFPIGSAQHLLQGSMYLDSIHCSQATYMGRLQGQSIRNKHTILGTWTHLGYMDPWGSFVQDSFNQQRLIQLRDRRNEAVVQSGLPGLGFWA